MTEENLEKIRKELDGKKITIQTDSTTDNRHSFVTNIILSEINDFQVKRPFLIYVITTHTPQTNESFNDMFHISFDKLFK